MIVLQFSGGIDSLAALFLSKTDWDKITVIWCDTGAAYPSTHELIEKLKRVVPNFQTVHTDKPAWEKINGIAVDTVPEKYTLLGDLVAGCKAKQHYTSFLRCCSANIWEPMDRHSRAMGAKVIIRGQRKEEELKSPVSDGYVDSFGVRYLFPVEDWTKKEVFEYCEKVCPEFVPVYYKQGEKTSRDCWDCIAYLHENQARINRLPADKRVVVFKRLNDYYTALADTTRPLRELMEGTYVY